MVAEEPWLEDLPEEHRDQPPIRPPMNSPVRGSSLLPRTSLALALRRGRGMARPPSVSSRFFSNRCPEIGYRKDPFLRFGDSLFPQRPIPKTTFEIVDAEIVLPVSHEDDFLAWKYSGCFGPNSDSEFSDDSASEYEVPIKPLYSVVEKSRDVAKPGPSSGTSELRTHFPWVSSAINYVGDMVDLSDSDFVNSESTEELEDAVRSRTIRFADVSVHDVPREDEEERSDDEDDDSEEDKYPGNPRQIEIVEAEVYDSRRSLILDDLEEYEGDGEDEEDEEDEEEEDDNFNNLNDDVDGNMDPANEDRGNRNEDADKDKNNGEGDEQDGQREFGGEIQIG